MWSTARRQPGLTAEDVDVVAGHFPLANRDRDVGPDGGSDVTRWFHDDVPFDGTVKAVDSRSGLRIELIGYGCAPLDRPVERMATELADAMTPQPRSRMFVGLGGSQDWSSAHATDTGSSGWGILGTIGVHVTAKHDFVLAIRGDTRDRYAPDPTLTEDAGFAMFGIRYSPFGPTRTRYPDLPGLAGVYVQGDAGYAELNLSSGTTSMTTGRGFVAGAALGWLGIRATDWVMGLELTDHVAFYNRGAGVRNTFSLGGFVELSLPSLFDFH